MNRDYLANIPACLGSEAIAHSSRDSLPVWLAFRIQAAHEKAEVRGNVPDNHFGKLIREEMVIDM
jgi:hypothetical protein